MAETFHKTCVRCEQSLPREAFYSARNRPDGLYPYCRECNKEWLRQRDAKDPAAAEARRLRKQAYDAVYNERHKERKRQQVLARYRRKTGEIKAQIRDWQTKNPERVRAYKQASKAARRATTEVGMTGAELHRWKQAQAKVCHWCGAKCARKYHVDHYDPLSRGGKHEAANLVIACPTCNLRKHAKDPFDFAREVGRLL